MNSKFFLLSFCMILFVSVFYFTASSSWYSGKEFEIITYDESATSKDTLTIMTYNLGYLSGMKNNLAVDMPEELFDENLEKARRLLDMYEPDIIGFQEIDFASSRSWNLNQLDSLSTGYYQAYRSVNWDKRYVPFPYWPLKYHFGKMLSGQAILSKYPLSNEETVVLQKPINAPFYYNKFYLDRLVQIADVQVGDRVVKVMNVHLEAFDPETRESQAVIVKELFERYANDMPVILIGDFNASLWFESHYDKTMKTITSASGLSSATNKNVGGGVDEANFTFSSGAPYQMIDYILYNPKFIQPIYSKVLQEAGEISDHFPVIMKFTFTSENDSVVSE